LHLPALHKNYTTSIY